MLNSFSKDSTQNWPLLAGEVEQRSHARSHRKVSPGSAHHSRVPSGSLPDPQNNYHDYHHVIKLIMDRARYKGARVGSRSRFLALRKRIDYSIKFPGRERGEETETTQEQERHDEHPPRIRKAHTIQPSKFRIAPTKQRFEGKERRKRHSAPGITCERMPGARPGRGWGHQFNTLIFASSQRKRNWKL